MATHIQTTKMNKFTILPSSELKCAKVSMKTATERWTIAAMKKTLGEWPLGKEKWSEETSSFMAEAVDNDLDEVDKGEAEEEKDEEGS